MSDHTKQENLPPHLEQQVPDKCHSDVDEQRIHRRFESAVKVSVEIPFVPTVSFGARNFSRCGMFLAYTDIAATKQMLEDNLVEPGKELMLQFVVSLHGTSHRCRVTAQIVRISEAGMAIEFGEKIPWQLAALVDLFNGAYPDTDTSSR